MKFVLSIASVLALASAARAATADEPTFVLEPGKPIEAVWPSGNRAQMVLSRNPAITAPVEFQVTENLCTQGIGQKLRVISGVRLDLIDWRWTQHKDVAKVGQSLTFTNPSDNKPTPITLGILMSSGSRYIDPKLIEGLPEDELEFEDVSWIPGLADGKLKPFTIDSWTAEEMRSNSQTGNSENRITAGENGMHISPYTERRARIEHSRDGFFTDKYMEPFTQS